jgi:hypothetical protein
MKKLALALILMIPVFAVGNEPPNPAPVEKKKETRKPVVAKVTYFVKTEARPTKNMIYIFDCSTSMGEDDRFIKATGEAKRILQYPLDDGMFSLFGFNTESDGAEVFSIWPGIKEKKTPKNWARLPSLIAVQSANKYLGSVSCWNWTNIYPAIEKAFTMNTKKEKLTIILFSDGNNTYPNWNGEKPATVAAKIEKLQKARVKAGKDRILIFVFGVGVNQNVKMLSAIAHRGGGSYLTTENYCVACAKHKTARADMQQFHEAGHGKKKSLQAEEAPSLEDDLPDYHGLPDQLDLDDVK